MEQILVTRKVKYDVSGKFQYSKLVLHRTYSTLGHMIRENLSDCASKSHV